MPAKYLGSRHIHLAAVAVAAAGVRAAYESGGDFENDQFVPDPLPTAPTSYASVGTYANVLPSDGSFYAHDGERRQRAVPWVEVTVGVGNDVRLESLQEGWADITLQIRSRVVADPNTYGGNNARSVGRAQALSLAHATRHVIERDVWAKARALDATDALGALGVTRRTLETVETTPPSPHDRQNATVFDGVTTVTFRQHQNRPKP